MIGRVGHGRRAHREGVARVVVGSQAGRTTAARGSGLGPRDGCTADAGVGRHADVGRNAADGGRLGEGNAHREAARRDVA